MIKNLVSKLEAGTKFQIWNRSPEVCNEIAAAFPGQIEVKQNACDVVQACDVTFSMLSTLEASKAVFDSPSGVIAGVSSGKVIVDCATLTPERMKEESDAIKGKGGHFLEAPVSGSKGPAETGTLIFLCGGDESVFERVKPGLDAMASTLIVRSAMKVCLASIISSISFSLLSTVSPSSRMRREPAWR